MSASASTEFLLLTQPTRANARGSLRKLPIDHAIDPLVWLILLNRYFGLTGTRAVETPSTPLDSVPCFLSELRMLRPDEQTLVLTVLLLAQVLDGEIDQAELVLWSRIYRHIGRMQPPDEDALRGCACAFRKGVLIDVQLLQAALDEDHTNDRPAELGLSDSIWVKTRKVLLK